MTTGDLVAGSCCIVPIIVQCPERFLVLINHLDPTSEELSAASEYVFCEIGSTNPCMFSRIILFDLAKDCETAPHHPILSPLGLEPHCCWRHGQVPLHLAFCLAKKDTPKNSKKVVGVAASTLQTDHGTRDAKSPTKLEELWDSQPHCHHVGKVKYCSLHQMSSWANGQPWLLNP